MNLPTTARTLTLDEEQATRLYCLLDSHLTNLIEEVKALFQEEDNDLAIADTEREIESLNLILAQLDGEG